jgi:hypothetical protein
MCCKTQRPPTDSEILDFLIELEFEGDIDPDIARNVAADFRKSIARDRVPTQFLGANGKPLPMTREFREKLANFIFPTT